MKKHSLKAVDFFCSGGGMTNGFRKAGINVLGGIDIDMSCKATYEKNNVGTKFIHTDIKDLTFESLQKELKIQRDDDRLIFIGCSPCQYWSKINTDKSKSLKSKNLLADFQKFVEHFNPGYVVIENVPGILSKLSESPLKHFLQFLKRKKYFFSYDIINAVDYGVPQTRRRFLLVASRLDEISLPTPGKARVKATVRSFIGDLSVFPPISAGTSDKTLFLHTCSHLTEINLERLRYTEKNGGTRMSYSKNKNLAIKSHYKQKNFSDSYGRMYWDKPAPTITTRFNSISNGRFAHPDQNRAISLREGATLQTFDLTYKFFASSQGGIAKQIGNAVPPLLSKKIALSIKKHYEKK